VIVHHVVLDLVGQPEAELAIGAVVNMEIIGHDPMGHPMALGDKGAKSLDALLVPYRPITVVATVSIMRRMASAGTGSWRLTVGTSARGSSTRRSTPSSS